MKTIGVLGGMSWESTCEYYRIMNEEVMSSLGGLHSAKIILHSVDFGEIEHMMAAGDWDSVEAALTRAARGLSGAGADLLVIATNTMHRLADQIEEAAQIPLIHIADAAGAAVAAEGLFTVGLLGTKFTMEEDFYRRRLEEKFGIRVLIPSPEEREAVDRIIFEELCRGIITPESKEEYRGIIARLVASGAEGVILGCTEIPLLIGREDLPVPLFDTTRLHAVAAVKAALSH